MKAKEYIEKYYQEGNQESSLATIVLNLFLEIETIANMRGAKTDFAILSIVKEQQIKWDAILIRVGLIHNNIFLEYVVGKIPEVGELLALEKTDMYRRKINSI